MALLPHEKAVLVHEGHRAVVHALDILLRALLVDDALAAVRLAQHHFEGVLAAVEAVEPQPSVGRVADAGNVLVGLSSRVDAVFPARREVGDPELDGGVLLPGLGVFERVGLVVELAVEAHHLHQRHFRFVEAQEGQLPSVGRESVGARRAELLLVDPVRRAVDDCVPRPVVGDALRFARSDVPDVEVVAVGVGDLPPVGRKGGVARRFGLLKNRPYAAVGEQVVLRRVGVAVDRRAARGDQDHPLVGREGVVGNREVRRGRGEQRYAFGGRGVGIAPDVVVLERGVVFAVGHRADALHALVHRLKTCDFVVFAPGGERAGAEGREGQKGESLVVQSG